MLDTFKQRLADRTINILKKYRLTPKKLLLIVLGFAALIILLAGLNKPHLSPFKEKMAMDHPCNIFLNDDGGVICDRQHSRLIILNKKHQVKSIISLNISGSPINRAGDMIISEDAVYVLGAVYTNRGMYLESESVAVYDRSGKFQKELFKIQYDSEDMETRPHLLTLWTDNGKLTIAGQNDQEFFIRCLNESGETEAEKTYLCQEKMFSAQIIGNHLAACDREGRIYFPDDQLGQMKISEGIKDFTDAVQIFEKDIDVFEKLEMLPAYSNMVFQFDNNHQIRRIFSFVQTENKICQYDLAANEVSTFEKLEISPWWTFKNLLFWLFTAYAVVLLIIGIIRLLVIKKKFWEWQRFLALVLMVTLVTGIYTYYSAGRIKQTYTTELSKLDQQVSAELQNGYQDVMSDVTKNGLADYAESEKGQKRLAAMENFLNSMGSACGKEVGYFIDVLVAESAGDIKMLADGRRVKPTSSTLEGAYPDLKNNTAVISNKADADGKYIVEQSQIALPDSSIAFIVESGCYEGNLYKQLRNEAVNLLVNLLALLITFWISFSVLRDIPKSVKEYRTKTKKGDPDAPVALTGLFTFIQQMVSLMDVVILVYVIQSMLLPSEQQYLSLISAVVMAVFSAGKILGNFLFFQFRIRIGERKTGIAASIGGIGAYLMMALAVATGDLTFLILGKLLSGFFVDSHLLVLSRGLPLGSKNEATRVGGLNKNQQSYTAGAILSALLAGYLSQYIAYTAVYLAGAVLCIPMLFISLKAFRPGVDTEVRDQYIAKKKQKKGLVGLIKRSSWMFYKTPSALIFVIFYTFPFVLMNGYQTYLFPLFSAGAGISALLLSNITVFGQALAYMTDAPVMKIIRHRDRLKTMTGTMGVLCACFICFYLSPNIWWAIIVLFMLYILYRIPRVGTMVYLSELAETESFDPLTVQPTYYSIENFFNVIQTPVLKTFISFGASYACAVLGVFCGIFISIFAALTGKRKKVKK